MDTIQINESIRVGAAFDNARVRPVWFKWQNRYYRVRKITLSWCSNKGAAIIHHYSVTTDETNMYELCFNAATLEWKLGKTSAG